MGKQNKPTLSKVTEPSSVPYRTPSACHGVCLLLQGLLCFCAFVLYDCILGSKSIREALGRQQVCMIKLCAEGEGL
jgi:hypothetical protein